MRLYRLAELRHLPEPEWLIDDLFWRQSLVMVAAPPGSFKSFLALDWSLCVAAGMPWLGHSVRQGPVLYLLGEGQSHLLARVSAWLTHRQPTPDERARLDEAFRVSFTVPQLTIPKEVDRLEHALARIQVDPALIVVDTLSRSYVGRKEQDPHDVSLWVDQAERIRQKGRTLLVLHHTPKNEEVGLTPRGTTAWPAAMDVVFVMQRRGPLVTLRCLKRKDREEGDPLVLRRVVVPVKQSTSLVLDIGALSDDPVPDLTTIGSRRVAKEISEQLGVHPERVRSALRRMARQSNASA